MALLPRCLILILLGLFLLQGTTQAQIENPDPKKLYIEDTKIYRQAKKVAEKEAMASDRPANDDLIFNAPTVDFDKEKNTFIGKGGLQISRQGIQVQAAEGEFNTETKQAELRGGIVFSTDMLSIVADGCKMNLDSETGEFENAQFFYEDGGFNIKAAKLNKVSEFGYALEDTDLTTCGCADGDRPWSISSNTTNITQEGYGHSYGVTFHVDGIPVFYSPYLAYPVKTKRTSGLLRPEIGYSNQDGVEFKIPLFLALSNSSDLTISPFTQSRTRNGAIFDIGSVQSKRHRIKSRILYSDESAREDDLRGFDVSGYSDPSIDTHRLAGFYKEIWRADPQGPLPASFIADLHYASDDLLIREIEDEDIASDNANFITSNVLLQSALGDVANLSLGAEYNQAILDDDDFVFQRLPELRLNTLKSFRPFGANALGAKLVSRADVTTTVFEREEGYDGTRIELKPSLRLPFHYQNYFASELMAGARKTFYDLSNTIDPDNGDELDDSNQRFVPEFGAQTSTAFERVFELEQDNWLTKSLQLGRNNQNDKLVRLKHVVEPYVRYSYIPEVSDQDELPFYDSSDRIRQRSVFLLGLRTTLFGKYESTNPTQEPISELTPLVEDLPLLNFDNPLQPYGNSSLFDEELENFRLHRGDIRELVILNIKESYDYLEDEKDLDPDRRPWSDLGSTLEFYPSRNFRMIFEDNWDIERHDFSSWGTALQFFDDRGDSVKARYSFIDESVSQIDGNVEVSLTKRLKVGYYGKFDDRDSEFIEHRAGLRLKSSCNCWVVDLLMRDRTNPDRRGFYLTVTLPGLGSLG